MFHAAAGRHQSAGDVPLGHLFRPDLRPPTSRFPPANAGMGYGRKHGSTERRRDPDRERSREPTPGRTPAQQRDDPGPLTADDWRHQIEGLHQRLNRLDQTQRDQALTVGRIREHLQSSAGGTSAAAEARITQLGDDVDRRFDEAGNDSKLESRICSSARILSLINWWKNDRHGCFDLTIATT